MKKRSKNPACGVFSLWVCVWQWGLLLPHWCAFVITLIEFIIYLLCWTCLTLLPFSGGEKMILWPWGAARDPDLREDVQVLFCPFKSHQAELIKMNDTKNCCKLSLANEITKTLSWHAAHPSEVWWNYWLKFKSTAVIFPAVANLPCVSDGRNPHQRHSSYQVLDWGPGLTRVLQTILVLVKITPHDTSTANSRVLPEEHIKV